MRDLVEFVVRSLVAEPDAVRVEELEEDAAEAEDEDADIARDEWAEAHSEGQGECCGAEPDPQEA